MKQTSAIPLRYQERIVEVPQVQTQEVIRHVPKVEIQERVEEVPRIEYQERIVEVPQVQTIERVVEVPQIQVFRIFIHRFQQYSNVFINLVDWSSISRTFIIGSLSFSCAIFIFFGISSMD